MLDVLEHIDDDVASLRRLGDLLATITSPALKNDLQQQQAVLAGMQSEAERSVLAAREQQLDIEQVMNNAQVNLLAARRELQRATQSIEMGVIRQLDFDIATDNLTKTELEFDHAKRAVEWTTPYRDGRHRSGTFVRHDPLWAWGRNYRGGPTRWAVSMERCR